MSDADLEAMGGDQQMAEEQAQAEAKAMGVLYGGDLESSDSDESDDEMVGLGEAMATDHEHEGGEDESTTKTTDAFGVGVGDLVPVFISVVELAALITSTQTMRNGGSVQGLGHHHHHHGHGPGRSWVLEHGNLLDAWLLHMHGLSSLKYLYLYQARMEGRMVVFMDGMDACGAQQHAIEPFVTTDLVRNVRVVATSRLDATGFRKAAYKHAFEHVRLLPLTLLQQQYMVRRRLREGVVVSAQCAVFGSSVACESAIEETYASQTALLNERKRQAAVKRQEEETARLQALEEERERVERYIEENGSTLGMPSAAQVAQAIAAAAAANGGDSSNSGSTAASATSGTTSGTAGDSAGADASTSSASSPSLGMLTVEGFNLPAATIQPLTLKRLLLHEIEALHIMGLQHVLAPSCFRLPPLLLARVS